MVMDIERVQPFIVATEDGVQASVKRLTKPGTRKVFGLDCEWDYNQQLRKGWSNIPDMVQIGTYEGYCALVRLCVLKVVPPLIQDILEDPEYIKVGVDIREDALKIWEHYGVKTRGILDLRYVAEAGGFVPKGLSGLCKSVLKVGMRKLFFKDHIWSSSRIKNELAIYAAWDAVSAVRIFDKLNQVQIRKRIGEDAKSMGKEEYHQATIELWKKYFGKEFSPRPGGSYESATQPRLRKKINKKVKSKQKPKRRKKR